MSEPWPAEPGGRVGRRRSWSAEEKARIVAESYDPATTVSEVARHHAINRNQLFSWRRQARERTVLGEATAPMAAGAATPRPASAGATAAPMIEVVIGRVLVRVRSDVDVAVLREVLRMVRGLD